MSFQLTALVADESCLAVLSAHRLARVVRVDQGLVIVPLYRALLHGLGPSAKLEGFEHVHQGVAAWAREISRTGAVGLFEASFEMGIGQQAAVLWRDGEIVFGPVSGGHTGRTVPRLSDWPVNRLLRELGVVAASGRDEWDTLRLGRHRRMEGWLEEAGPLRRASGE
jgi:hypothetical protein